MTHPTEALRAAVRTYLLSQSDLTAMISGVFETAPANAQYPYVTFGDDRIDDWSTQTFTGTSHQLLINTWSQSHNFGELYGVHRLLRQRLLSQNITLPDFKLVGLFKEEERFLVDRRRNVRLGVLRYRALVHAADITPA